MPHHDPRPPATRARTGWPAPLGEALIYPVQDGMRVDHWDHTGRWVGASVYCRRANRWHFMAAAELEPLDAPS